MELNREQTMQEMLELYNSEEFSDFLSQYNSFSPRFAELPIDSKLALYYSFINNNGSLHADLAEYEALLFDRKIVSIDEFLDSPNYLGAGGALYPRWRQDMRTFLAPESTHYEWVFSGGIGTGKTTIARIVALYKLYMMLCLRNPQATFGKTSADTFSMVFLGITHKKTIETALKPFVVLLRGAKGLFHELDDQTKLLTYSGDKIPFCYNIADGVVRFNKNITVCVGSTVEDLVGHNVFSAFYDEASRAQATADGALEVYTELKNRIHSRFGRSRYCFVGLISSATHEADAVQMYIKNLSLEVKEKYVSVSTYTRWEVATRIGDDPFINGYFFVINGSSNFPSQILEKEVGEQWWRDRSLVPSGCELIKIPLEYISDFKMSLTKALQDIAGVPTSLSSALFPDVSKIEDERLAPTLRLSIPTVERGKIMAAVASTDMLRVLPPMCLVDNPVAVAKGAGVNNSKRTKQWYRNPSLPRYIGVDLAETGEAGLAVVHKELDYDTGNTVYVADLICTFYSPTRIRIESIYELIAALHKDVGLFIHTLAFDQYQSALLLQRAKENYLSPNCIRFSVDSTPDSYLFLANLVSQEALKCGTVTDKDGLTAQMRVITVDPKGKIVKPNGIGESKRGHCDALDALVSAVYCAYQNRADIPTALYMPPDMDAEQNKEALVGKALERLGLSW